MFHRHGVKPPKTCNAVIHIKVILMTMPVLNPFHSLIKRKWLNRFNIKNYRHAYNLIFEYIETFYNTVRIHSHCDYMSPDEFEKMYERVKSLPVA